MMTKQRKGIRTFFGGLNPIAYDIILSCAAIGSSHFSDEHVV